MRIQFYRFNIFANNKLRQSVKQFLFASKAIEHLQQLPKDVKIADAYVININRSTEFDINSKYVIATGIMNEFLTYVRNQNDIGLTLALVLDIMNTSMENAVKDECLKTLYSNSETRHAEVG